MTTTIPFTPSIRSDNSLSARNTAVYPDQPIPELGQVGINTYDPLADFTSNCPYLPIVELHHERFNNFVGLILPYCLERDDVDIMRSRAIEQQVLDMLDEPPSR
jgi:hypothetical protein